MHRHLVALALTLPATAGPAEPPRVVDVEARLLAEAKQGAERHRKADATLLFTRGDGTPLAGASVSIRQETRRSSSTSSTR